MLDPRQREIVRTLWEQGRLSRWQLHERTGLTPNGVGAVAEGLLGTGVLRECAPEAAGAGRPRTPLEIDPARRNAVGLAIGPGRVEACRVGLRGQPIGRPLAKAVASPGSMVAAAARLLERAIDRETLAVGVSVTGFVDPIERAVLFSSALPGRSHASLAPIYGAAGDVPVVLENDMHALAARWMLAHRVSAAAAGAGDVLLVRIDDGRLGAAMLIDGRPNRGCATGGSELGHCRFFVETRPCYCGHAGCLERIVSTDFLRRHSPSGRGNGRSHRNRNGSSLIELPLATRAARFDGHNDSALSDMLRYLARGLANAVNFVRPHRLVLVGALTRCATFTGALIRQTRGEVLPELADRVRFDLWDEPTIGSGETAGWLALANLLYGGWGAS